MDAKKKSDSVRRLKRIIVMSVMIIILIPSVMCIFLFSRVNDLERQVDDYEKVSGYISVRAL